jgi:hypothetical protein
MARARCRLGARRLSTRRRSSLCLFGAKLRFSRLLGRWFIILDSGARGGAYVKLRLAGTVNGLNIERSMFDVHLLVTTSYETSIITKM